MPAMESLEVPVRQLDSRDEPLFEVIHGQCVELPPMSILAARIAGRLHTRLDAHAEAHGLGTVVCEALLVLDAKQELKRRPDVAFVSKARWPAGRVLPEEGDWQVVPDLAVEVVSPSDLFEGVISKKNEYFRMGVKEVWIVVPSSNELLVYQAANNCRVLTLADDLDGGQVLPGWRLPLATLFDRRPFSPDDTGPEPRSDAWPTAQS